MRHDTLVGELKDPIRPEHSIGYLTGPDPVFTTYGELLTRASRILGLLQRRNLRPGSTAALVTSDIQAFIETFWACLLGGIAPLPVSSGAAPENQEKISRILELFDHPPLIVDDQGWDRLRAFTQDDPDRVKGLQVLSTRDIRAAADSGEPGDFHDVRPSDLAYVQFSSGSTRAPKGIHLTHENLVANTDGIIQAIQLEPEDRPHAWMPLTHDMGLIGGHLTPMMRGTNHTLIPTERFVRRPLSWLTEAATHGVTVTSGPNFAYQHTLRAYRPQRLEGVDLSAVRVIFNGAEPISYPLVSRFLKTMEAHGLRPASMFPVYGLAEASLAMTMPPLLSGLRRLPVDRAQLNAGDEVRVTEEEGSLELVPLGQPIPHAEVRIAGERPTPQMPEGVVGTIWIRGTNVTNTIRTEAGDVHPKVDGWYDTGDLGFVLDGDMYVAGRVKEMAIVNGQNVFPHDIEAVAAEVPGVEPGKVVAAGVREPETQREVLALFVVWRKDEAGFDELRQTLREVVTARTGVPVTIVHPVTKIAKTTSGKIQRIQMAREFEQNHSS